MVKASVIHGATRAGGMRFSYDIKEVRSYPSNALKYLIAISRWNYDQEVESDYLLADTEQDINPLINIWVQDRLERYSKRAEDADARFGWRWKIQKIKEARHGSGR